MTDATPLASEQITADLEGIGKFVDDFFAPWGSWKTAWWEDEVSDVAAFSAENALKHVANKARRLAAALSATPAPNGVVPLDEPNCTNNDYLRRKALTEMVAMDEQMEAEHPGWMTG